MLGVSSPRVRAMARAGWCRPARDGRQYRFAFQDLVLLRAAVGLLKAEIPPRRVRRALSELVRQLPVGSPLSGVRIIAAGGRVVARAGERLWQPESGQLQFAFTVDDLARQVRQRREPPRRARSSPAESAEDCFARAVGLEDADPKGAQAAYERALELDPDHADSWVNLGRLAHQAGDAAKAARCYHEALGRQESDPVTHYNLALACEDLGKIPQALDHYSRALALNPEFADAHYNLGQLLSRLGRRAEALRHLTRYRQLLRGR